jgi:hypothetical protein
MRHLAAAALVALIVSYAAFGSGVSEDDSFSCLGIEAVSVNAGFLNVDVSGDDGFAVSVSADLPGDAFVGSRGCKVLHAVEGSRLRVWVENERPFDGRPEGTLVIQCPRDVGLKVETISGRIAVERMNAGHCVLRTVSGGINLDDSRGAMSAASVSGEIKLDADEGRVTSKTVSGAISGRGLVLEEGSSFSTISGNVDVRLDMPLETVRFDLRSLSGRIVVGSVRAERGLRMGTDGALVRGQSVSGALIFR